MSWCRGFWSTRTRHRAHPGFTLIELMVVAALLVILTMMAFSGFRYLTAVMNRTIDVTKARENLSVVMDQLTKELREVTTVTTGTETNDGSSPQRANYGVTLPMWTSTLTSDASRGIPGGTWDYNTSVLTSASPKHGALASGQSYVFNTTVGNLSPNGNCIVLEFFTIDTSVTPTKHRIRYSLTAPNTSGGAYNGLGQQFWASSAYEPCVITYCSNTWVSTDGGFTYHWTTEQPQPMTDQVVTGFTVTRPSWSPNVVQITLEAQVRSLSGTGYGTIRLIELVTVRQ
jgi:prepilin-type N-terminal cleavage/methylation domain-containing protein